jgi:hypothetical protein
MSSFSPAIPAMSVEAAQSVLLSAPRPNELILSSGALPASRRMIADRREVIEAAMAILFPSSRCNSREAAGQPS